MPKCVLGDRTIDPDLERVGNREVPAGYGTVEHVVPLSKRGRPGHVWSNLRAAYSICNREVGRGPAMP